MNWGPLLTPIWVSNFVRVLHMVVRSLWSLSIDNLIKVRVENWILKCSAWGSLFETLVNADVRLTDAVFQRGADLKAIVLSLMSIYFQLALRPLGRICSLIEIVPVFEDWWLSHWVAFKVLCAFVEVIIHQDFWAVTVLDFLNRRLYVVPWFEPSLRSGFHFNVVQTSCLLDAHLL